MGLEELSIVRFEQEQAQKRSTRHQRAKSIMNDNTLIGAKQKYLNGVLHLEDYQKQLRFLSYRSINIFEKTDKDDNVYEPNNQ